MNILHPLEKHDSAIVERDERAGTNQCATAVLRQEDLSSSGEPLCRDGDTSRCLCNSPDTTWS